MKFAISLRRSADPSGEDEWRLKHFSSVDFGDLSSSTQASVIQEHVEMSPLGCPNDKLQIRGP